MDRNREHQAFPTASSSGVRAGGEQRGGILTAEEQQQEELHVWQWQLRCLGEPEVLPVAPFMATVYLLSRAPPSKNPKWANTDNPCRIGPATCASLSWRCWRPGLRDALRWGSPLQRRFQWTGMSGAGWG